MVSQFEKKKILIVVMTYPIPSRSYTETICTAGLTKDGEWVRLYPIDYRYLDSSKQFRKYQWIEVELGPRNNEKDKRLESRRPKIESISLFGEPISTKNNWSERKHYIDKSPVRTLNELKVLYDENRVSLGIVQPSIVHDIKIESVSPRWKPSQENALSQLKLFGPQPKPLTKIPYKFSYVFECNDSKKTHNAMIEDWELGVLFLKEVDRLGSQEKAAASVRNKFLNDICSKEKDTKFFMGTTFPFNSWVVLGLFYPKAEEQLSLF